MSGITCRKGLDGKKYYRDDNGPITAAKGKRALGGRCQSLSAAAKLENACERLEESREASPKKPSPKKRVVARKAAPKKAVVRKPAATKKTAVRKVAVKKAAPKKKVAKKASPAKDRVYVWSVRSKNIDGEKYIVPYRPVTVLPAEILGSERAIRRIYRDAELPEGSLMMTDAKTNKAIESFVNLRKTWTRDQWSAFGNSAYPIMMNSIQVLSVDGPEFEMLESDYVARIGSRPSRNTASAARRTVAPAAGSERTSGDFGSDSRRLRDSPNGDRRRNYVWAMENRSGVMVPTHFVGALTDEQMGDRGYHDTVRRELRQKGILGGIVAIGRETQSELSDIFRRAEDWSTDRWRDFWDTNEGLESLNRLLKSGWSNDLGNVPARRFGASDRPKTIPSPVPRPVVRSAIVASPVDAVTNFLFGVSPARASPRRSAILARSPPVRPGTPLKSPSRASPAKSPIRARANPSPRALSGSPVKPWAFSGEAREKGWIWKTESSGWLFGKYYPKTLVGAVSGDIFADGAENYLLQPDVAYLLRQRPASGPYIYVDDEYVQRGLESFIASDDVQAFRAHFDKNQEHITQLNWDY